MIREINLTFDDMDDPKLVDQGYFRDLIPKRKQIVENYLADINGFEQESANYLAAQLQDSDKPLADTVVLIPIAAHQEYGNIENAMDQYATQQPRRPFSILLYPNAPYDSDAGAVDKTVSEIEKAKKKHPHLDIRSSAPELYDTPTIGTIRRTLWNAALLLAHFEGRFDDPTSDVIGLNHDIDVVRMTPRYIGRVQGKVDKTQQNRAKLGMSYSVSPPHSTFVKHAHDPVRPNSAKATFWHDFAYWQLRPRGAFDAGLVLPFSYYAAKNGAVAEAKTNEMSSLLNNQTFYVIPGTVLETSPRRFSERLPQLNDLDGRSIWTEDSFGANDVCRTQEDVSDISRLHLESLVDNSLDSSIDLFFDSTIRKFVGDKVSYSLLPSTYEPSAGELIDKLERKKNLAATVLERVMELPYVASRVRKNYDTSDLAQTVISSIPADTLGL